MYRCFLLAPLSLSCKNTSAQLSSIPNPVSASSVRESDVPTGESSLTPGSIQISPRELTRSQGELARSSQENADPVTERRRIVGKRTTISLAPFVLSDNVDSASVPESLNEAGSPEVLEPSEGDTKNRRVESFDESVDWCQKERSAIAWMTNVSNEREIFEIDVGDPLQSERSFYRDSSVWLSKRLSDGKSSEITHHLLLPGQQLQFDEAMTKELSQVWAANAVRRLSQEEELNLTETGRQRRGWSFWSISIRSLQVYQLLERCLVICYFKHAHCTNFVSILVLSLRLSCKHRPLKSIKS